MAVNLNGVEETLFIPLWGRAYVSTHYPSLFYDAKAIDLVRSIDYDFSHIRERFPPEFRLISIARARQCDDAIRAYISDHPRASVISLGVGLDTGFFRIDNGLIEWYNLDLPDVIALREQLIPDTDRTHTIAKSLLDMSWCDDLDGTYDGVFVVANAVLMYIDERELKTFFSELADRLPGAEMVFNATSSNGVNQNNEVLCSIGMEHAPMKWSLDDANDLSRWDERITVLNQHSYFLNIPFNEAWGGKRSRSCASLRSTNRGASCTFGCDRP